MPKDRKHRLIDHLKQQGVEASVEVEHEGVGVELDSKGAQALPSCDPSHRSGSSPSASCP